MSDSSQITKKHNKLHVLCPDCNVEFILDLDTLDTEKIPTLCGYSNCFSPFYKMRGFMPTCKKHFNNPKKWGKDGQTYTGTVWVKK